MREEKPKNATPAEPQSGNDAGEASANYPVLIFFDLLIEHYQQKTSAKEFLLLARKMATPESFLRFFLQCAFNQKMHRPIDWGTLRLLRDADGNSIWPEICEALKVKLSTEPSVNHPTSVSASEKGMLGRRAFTRKVALGLGGISLPLLTHAFFKFADDTGGKKSIADKVITAGEAAVGGVTGLSALLSAFFSSIADIALHCDKAITALDPVIRKQIGQPPAHDAGRVL